jgi:hypothetical protein
MGVYIVCMDVCVYVYVYTLVVLVRPYIFLPYCSGHITHTHTHTRFLLTHTHTLSLSPSSQDGTIVQSVKQMTRAVRGCKGDVIEYLGSDQCTLLSDDLNVSEAQLDELLAAGATVGVYVCVCAVFCIEYVV